MGCHRFCLWIKRKPGQFEVIEIKISSKLAILSVCVILASLLVLGGCKSKAAGKSVSTTVDLTNPPQLPEETGVGNAPAAPTRTAPAQTNNSTAQKAPPPLPLLGG